MSLQLLPRSFHVNSAGRPYGLARLYHYRAGTLTTLNLYTSRTFVTPHAQPVEADANGIFPAMYINPAEGFNLRLILKTSADVVIYDEDNIEKVPSSFESASFSGAVAADGNIQTLARLISLLGILQLSGATPEIDIIESDRGTDLKRWKILVDQGSLSIVSRTDADGTGKFAISIARGTTTAIQSIALGNLTDAIKILLPSLYTSTSYANDAAAAGGGVELAQLYRNGSVVQIRMA